VKQKLLERDARPRPVVVLFSSKNAASIFEVLLASINIMETRITQSRLAFDRPDVIIHCVGHIRLLEFGRAAEIIAIGYEHTQGQLALLSPRGKAGALGTDSAAPKSPRCRDTRVTRLVPKLTMQIGA